MPPLIHSREDGDQAAVTIRDGVPADIGTLQALILEHGPNQWNHLPVGEVRAHVAGIADDRIGAVVATAGSTVVAVVTYEVTGAFGRYQPSTRVRVAQGHVCEAVVHHDHVGRGIGARLLRTAVARLQERGCVDIYIERHEHNAASAGMMRKAGFVVVDSFADPLRRPHGSGRTTVCHLQCVP